MLPPALGQPSPTKARTFSTVIVEQQQHGCALAGLQLVGNRCIISVRWRHHATLDLCAETTSELKDLRSNHAVQLTRVPHHIYCTLQAAVKGGTVKRLMVSFSTRQTRHHLFFYPPDRNDMVLTDVPVPSHRVVPLQRGPWLLCTPARSLCWNSTLISGYQEFVPSLSNDSLIPLASPWLSSKTQWKL